MQLLYVIVWALSSAAAIRKLRKCRQLNHFKCPYILLPMAAYIAKKTLPKRLEDELNSIPKFKPTNGNSRRTVSDVLDDSVERAVYDEIFGSVINKRPLHHSAVGSESVSSNNSSNAKANIDFTSSLITRLADAEEESKSLRKQVLEKNVRINTVERENAQLRAVADAPTHLIHELENFKSVNYLLEKQVDDMEKFLYDYGLQWVGNKTSNVHEVAEQLHQTGMVDNVSRPIDYSALALKVEELNSVLSSEPSQVKSDSRRGKIVHAGELFKSIDVSVYCDGIMIKRGPFRNSQSDSWKSFVRDIMDGFFPSEFRSEYPDGVMFRLIDRHNIPYGGSEDQAVGILSKEDLLRNVRKVVLKDGNLVPMRSNIAQLLEKGNSSDSSSCSMQDKGRPRDSHIALDTSASASLRIDGDRDREDLGDVARRVAIFTENAVGVDGSPTATAVASVQVRWLDGTMLLVVLFESDCVEDIKKEILKHTQSAAYTYRGTARLEVDYELRSAHPPRVLTDTMTLKAAGLVPNGTIHARAIIN